MPSRSTRKAGRGPWEKEKGGEKIEIQAGKGREGPGGKVNALFACSF